MGDMRRFEMVEGTSSKFWEIALEGASFTVRFGRIGTDGQTQNKSFQSPTLAQTEHDKLVAEKVKKGYREVSAPRARASKGVELRSLLSAPAPSIVARFAPTVVATEDDPYACWTIGNVEIAGDGRTAIAATAGFDREATLGFWSIDSGELLRKVDLGKSSGMLAVHPDGAHVFVAMDGGTIDVLRIEDGRKLGSITMPPPEVSGQPPFSYGPEAPLAFSPDGARLFVAPPARPPQVICIDATTGALVRRYEGLRDYPFQIAVDRDGKRLIALAGYAPGSGRKDQRAEWDVESGQKLETSSFKFAPHLGRAFPIEGQPGRGLLTEPLATTEGGVEVSPLGFRAPGGDITHGLPLPFPGSWARSVLARDGRRMIFARGGPVKIFVVDLPAALAGRPQHGLPMLFDAADSKLLALADGKPVAIDLAAAKASPVTGDKLAWSGEGWFLPDGKRLIVNLYGIALYDLEKGKARTVSSGTMIRGVVVHPDGRRILAAGQGGQLTVIDGHEGKVLKVLKETLHDLQGVALLPDGTRALTGGADGKLRLWDIEAGKAVRGAPSVFRKTITKLAPTRDGRFAVAVGDGSTCAIIDLASLEVLGRFEFAGREVVLPSIERPVSVHDGSVRVYSTGGKSVRTIPLHEGTRQGECFLYALADGEHVIVQHPGALGSGAEVSVVDVERGKVVARAPIDEGLALPPSKLVVSPSGRLFTAQDGTGRLHVYAVDGLGSAPEAPPAKPTKASKVNVKVQVKPQPKAKAKKVKLPPPLDFSEVAPMKSPARVTAAELDVAERALGTPLPKDYRQFMTRVGPGYEYMGALSIHPLAKVKQQDFTDRAFIWPNTGDVLSIEEVQRLVSVGFAVNGDEIVFVAGDPSRLLVLPRNAGPIVELPTLAHVFGKYRPEDEDE